MRWYLFDGLGSVVGELDPSGTVSASRKYDVYGAVRSSAGTSTSSHKFVGSLGHASEDNTGLVYMQARYMDPVTGRFASEDPSRSGENWFTYANASPTVAVDPTGRDVFDFLAMVTMALAILSASGLSAAIEFCIFMTEMEQTYATGHIETALARAAQMEKMERNALAVSDPILKQAFESEAAALGLDAERNMASSVDCLVKARQWSIIAALLEIDDEP